MIDVNINFDSRMKGKSKMSLKILVDLIFMIFKNLRKLSYFNLVGPPGLEPGTNTL